jgi:hypothetical protein
MFSCLVQFYGLNNIYKALIFSYHTSCNEVSNPQKHNNMERNIGIVSVASCIIMSIAAIIHNRRNNSKNNKITSDKILECTKKYTNQLDDTLKTLKNDTQIMIQQFKNEITDECAATLSKAENNQTNILSHSTIIQDAKQIISKQIEQHNLQLQQQLEQITTANKDAIQTIDDLKKDILNKCQTQLTNLEQLEKKIPILNDTKKNIIQTISIQMEQYNETFKNKSEQIDTITQNATKTMEQLKEDMLKKSQNQLQELKKLLNEAPITEASIKTLQDNISEQIKQHNETFKEQITQINFITQQAQNEIKTLKDEVLLQYKQKFDDLQQLIQKIPNIDNTKQQIEQVVSTQIEQHNETFKKQLEEVEQAKKDATEAINSLKGDILEQHQSQLNKLTQLIQDAPVTETTMKELQSNISEQIKQHDQILKEKFQQIESTKETLMKTIESFQSEIASKTENQLVIDKENNSIIQTNITTYKESLNSYQKSIAEYQQQIKKIQQALESYIAKNSNQIEISQKLNTNFSQLTQQFEDTKKILETQTQEMQLLQQNQLININSINRLEQHYVSIQQIIAQHTDNIAKHTECIENNTQSITALLEALPLIEKNESSINEIKMSKFIMNSLLTQDQLQQTIQELLQTQDLEKDTDKEGNLSNTTIKPEIINDINDHQNQNYILPETYQAIISRGIRKFLQGDTKNESNVRDLFVKYKISSPVVYFSAMAGATVIDYIQRNIKRRQFLLNGPYENSQTINLLYTGDPGFGKSAAAEYLLKILYPEAYIIKLRGDYSLAGDSWLRQIVTYLYNNNIDTYKNDKKMQLVLFADDFLKIETMTTMRDILSNNQIIVNINNQDITVIISMVIARNFSKQTFDEAVFSRFTQMRTIDEFQQNIIYPNCYNKELCRNKENLLLSLPRVIQLATNKENNFLQYMQNALSASIVYQYFNTNKSLMHFEITPDNQKQLSILSRAIFSLRDLYGGISSYTTLFENIQPILQELCGLNAYINTLDSKHNKQITTIKIKQELSPEEKYRWFNRFVCLTLSERNQYSGKIEELYKNTKQKIINLSNTTEQSSMEIEFENFHNQCNKICKEYNNQISHNLLKEDHTKEQSMMIYMYFMIKESPLHSLVPDVKDIKIYSSKQSTYISCNIFQQMHQILSNSQITNLEVLNTALLSYLRSMRLVLTAINWHNYTDQQIQDDENIKQHVDTLAIQLNFYLNLIYLTQQEIDKNQNQKYENQSLSQDLKSAKQDTTKDVTAILSKITNIEKYNIKNYDFFNEKSNDIIKNFLYQAPNLIDRLRSLFNKNLSKKSEVNERHSVQQKSSDQLKQTQQPVQRTSLQPTSSESSVPKSSSNNQNTSNFNELSNTSLSNEDNYSKKSQKKQDTPKSQN